MSALISTPRPRARRFFSLVIVFAVLLLAVAIGLRLWFSNATQAALPQIDGEIKVQGLASLVRIERDPHGIPHLIAASIDDLVFAQGYITAQDRLWQMDILRRHAAGELAEILGSSLIPHDKLQRYLQMRASADRALPLLDPAQRHSLEVYARGVNALIAAQQGRLPIEFRVLGYQPKPWTARDSLLIAFALAQDLSTGFPDKLNREAVVARLPPELQGDLYPVGSWRDHPPADGKPDLTAPQEVGEVPLDNSQAFLQTIEHTNDLASVEKTLALFVSRYACDGCFAGSNNWVVSGAHTSSGRPLLANDPHLALGIPGIWYEADLEAPGFHAAGVTLPGAPFVILGHNQHIAWGFTNSGADVQDLYLEDVQNGRYKTADGNWLPLEHTHELIHVARGHDVDLEIAFTHHGDTATPILSPLYPAEKRQIALRWNLFDPATASSPFQQIDSATDWKSFLAALENFSSPSQSVVYADDQGHIGFHLNGKIPVRGDAAHPSGLSPVPVPTGSYEWSGYIPFDQLPQVFDPQAGLLATANARITPDGYPHSIALDWGPPYRNERIWQLLAAKPKFDFADMLTIQNDVTSDLDRTIAQRVAYAVDHTRSPSKRMRQAADLLRGWDGNVAVDSSAAAIVNAVKNSFWSILLAPHLGEAAKLYTWRSRSFAMEEMVTRMPARWLPTDKSDWNELLASILDRSLTDSHAPDDLTHWQWGSINRLNQPHPIFGQNALLPLLLGQRTGPPAQPLPGDISTVRPGSPKTGASQRFTADPGDPEHATLNLPYGQSGQIGSPWYLDQFPLWVQGRTLPLPFTSPANSAHTLTLIPQ